MHAVEPIGEQRSERTDARVEVVHQREERARPGQPRRQLQDALERHMRQRHTRIEGSLRGGRRIRERRPGTGTVTGTKPVNQPASWIRRSAAYIDGGKAVIRSGPSQLVHRERGAGQHAADEPGAGIHAGGFESCVCSASISVTDAGRRRELGSITEWQREIREASAVIFGELDPGAHLRESRVSADVNRAAGHSNRRSCPRRAAGGRRACHQRGVHHLELHESHPDELSVAWR